MGNFINSLNSDQRKNLDLVAGVLIDSYDNLKTVAGILAVVGKEGKFSPKSVNSYAGTSNARIREVFGSRVAALNDVQLNALKANPAAFFERVYGKDSGVELGNMKVGDGYKYRERGFNQILGRGNYKAVGKEIGEDLENNPDLLLKPEIAAKALVAYINRRANGSDNKLNEYNAKNINDFKTVSDSVNAVYHINAGWGKSKVELEKDHTGGLAKAREYAPEFYEYLQGKKKNSVFGNWKMWLAVLLLIGLFLFFKLRK